jgi:hypothetical protein
MPRTVLGADTTSWYVRFSEDLKTAYLVHRSDKGTLKYMEWHKV